MQGLCIHFHLYSGPVQQSHIQVTFPTAGDGALKACVFTDLSFGSTD